MFLALKSNVNKLNQTKSVKKSVLLCYVGFKIGKKSLSPIHEKLDLAYTLIKLNKDQSVITSYDAY